MTPTRDSRAAQILSTAELEAAAALHEIREHGAYVLVDLDGCIHIMHARHVPSALKTRLATHYNEVVRVILECAQ